MSVKTSEQYSAECVSIARSFHDTYEKNLQSYGWMARDRQLRLWGNAPIDHLTLILGTVNELLEERIIEPGNALLIENLRDG